jgi:hypothetical protein
VTRPLDAALFYAGRLGWPVGPAQPQGKAPLTRHGVKDFTTDAQLLIRWWRRWPDANVAVGCGLPGPTVLDIDDLGRAGEVARLDAPTVATANGRHLYFAGQARGTVVLDYGELRGTGSYVVCPPSVHPSGKAYVWLAEPNGPLPQVPGGIAGRAVTAGRGEHRPPAELVPFRRRHPYMRDFTVRLLRAGVTDPGDIAAHLRLEFERRCVPNPPPAAGYFDELARWGARTRIAQRERSSA